jgi:signal transduction histidine kinase
MSTLNVLSLIASGVGLALAALMLLLVIWLEWRSTANILHALFTLSAVIWYSGLLLGRTGAAINVPEMVTFGVRLGEFGFAGFCMAMYLLTAVLSGGTGRFFLWTAVIGVLIVTGYQAFLVYIAADPLYEATADGTLIYAYEPLWSLMYGLLAAATIFVIWQRRRKIADQLLRAGFVIAAFGALIEVISPQFRGRGLSLLTGAMGVLIINYAQIRLQIVRPLAGREDELRAFRDVGLAITSRLRLDEALKTIAAQAAAMLHADGAAIFLRHGTALELVAVHNMPERLIGHRLILSEGLAGKVITEQRTSRVEDYRRDWRGTIDMPYARESFGAVIAVPLIFDQDALGTLLVIENPLGKRFDRGDVRLLELLGPQAAVAIANSRLFEQQQELDRLKNQMIRMTSHDLKNPLFAAMQHVELLQDELEDAAILIHEQGLEDIFTAEMRADTKTIWTQLARMNRIIRGILDMERIQSGTPTYESFDAAEIIALAVSELKDQAQAQQITLNADVPADLPWVIGDRHYLMQALTNLIENAIKFTPKLGTVTVSAEIAADALIWHVRDSGIGISAEAQTRIFERFYRAHQNYPGWEQVSGSGLGLSLVKAVADAHGGRVWLDSAVGEGTTFHLSLPLAGPKDASI